MTTNYTTEQIAALLASITPGEWTYSEYHPWVRWGDREPEPTYELDGPVFSTYGEDLLDREGDAAFIAAAPAIVAQQQDRIAALEAVLDLIATGAYARDGAMVAAKNVLQSRGGDA